MDELYRQVLHLVFGVLIAIVVFALPEKTTVALLILSIFIGAVLSDLISKKYHIPLISELVDKLDRKDIMPGRGALFFVIGVVVPLLFFEKEIVFLGVLVHSVLDSVSTIVGQNFGKHRTYNKKSLEGSLAGFVSALLLLFLFSNTFAFLAPNVIIIVALIATLSELFIPVNDNLIIPLITSVTLGVVI